MSIVIGGDICVTSDAYEKMKNDGVSALFDQATFDIFSTADLALVNLECPLTESDKKIIKSGPNHKTHIDSKNILYSLNVSLASIANNHIFDYGKKGLEDTIKAVTDVQIGIVGAKCDANSEFYQIRKINNYRLGFISFADDEFNGLLDSGDISVYDPLQTFDEIKSLKEQCEAVVVLYHTGLEHYEYPTPYLQRVCRKMIDSGADMVLCQHSHCIGAEEFYNDGYILYGQGNFHFYREANKTDKWNSSILVRIRINSDNKLERELIFVKNENGTVTVLDNDCDARHRFEERSVRVVEQGFIEKNFQSFCQQNKKEFVLAYLRGKSKWYYRLMKVTRGNLLSVLLPKERAVLVSNMIRSNVHNEIVRTVLKAYIYDEER